MDVLSAELGPDLKPNLPGEFIRGDFARLTAQLFDYDRAPVQGNTDRPTPQSNHLSRCC